jgi:hypothetical protein
MNRPLTLKWYVTQQRAHYGAVNPFFHISVNVYPSLLSLEPKSSENVIKNSLEPFCLNFFDFFENLQFSDIFKINFPSQLQNQSLENFQGIIFDE